jgi:hypothetical protein
MNATPKGLANAEFRLTPGLTCDLDKLQELQTLLYAARDALACGEALSTIERQRLDGALDDLMVSRRSSNAPPGAPHTSEQAKQHNPHI